MMRSVFDVLNLRFLWNNQSAVRNTCLDSEILKKNTIKEKARAGKELS